VGELRKALFGSPKLASELGPAPSIEALRERPFVGPIARDGGEFVQSNDDCPLGPGERTVGAEVGTMDLALKVAAACDQLVFGPVISAHRELADGSLVEIPIAGWDTREELYLACDVERVLARVQSRIVSAVREATLDAPRAVPLETIPPEATALLKSGT
jgi:hypothetical protein